MKKTLAILFLASACWAQPAPKRPVPKPPNASSSAPQSEPAQAEPSQDSDSVATFRVQVRLVNVFATVTDNHGAPVGGLTKDDFKIYEDGVLQQISVFDRESGLPLNIVMAIDASLSTRKDLPLELESARRFAHTILRPQKDAMSVYQFSEVVNELQPFTSDLRMVDRGIDRVHTGASTALYDAVFLGSEALNRRDGRKVMIVITDGGDTASKTSYQEALRAAQISESIVFSIIMVPIEASAGRDLGGEHALIQLSEDTGGKYYYATSLPQLDSAFRQISDELRTQYLVAYYPPKVARDDFRRITLEVTRPAPEGAQFKARYRTGYYTSKLQ